MDLNAIALIHHPVAGGGLRPPGVNGSPAGNITTRRNVAANQRLLLVA